MKDLTFLSIARQCAMVDRPRSTIYSWIAQGVWPPPIKLGPRCAGNPQSEIDAVLKARIAGKSEAEIKRLVQDLVNARAEIAA